MPICTRASKNLCWKRSVSAFNRLPHTCSDVLGHHGSCVCSACGTVIDIKPRAPQRRANEVETPMLSKSRDKDERSQVASGGTKWANADVAALDRLVQQERRRRAEYELTGGYRAQHKYLREWERENRRARTMQWLRWLLWAAVVVYGAIRVVSR